VWGMQPLAYGFLGGRYDEHTVFPADDLRSRMPAGVRAALAVGARGASAAFAAHAGAIPLATVALAWCLACPDLARGVVGPRSVAHLRSVVDALAVADNPEFATFVARHRARLTQSSSSHLTRGETHE